MNVEREVTYFEPTAAARKFSLDVGIAPVFKMLGVATGILAVAIRF